MSHPQSPARLIAPIGKENRSEAYRVLATAFANDPVTRWAISDPRRDATAFRGMDLALHGAAEGSDLLYENGVAVGAAFWDPPGFEPPASQVLRALPVLTNAVRTRLFRGVSLARAVHNVRPKEPHWYLASIGAAVSGRGVGSELLRHRLDRIKGPAYLESSNILNNPLYERFGFRVVAEIRPTRTGPTLWAMRRD
ncbi:MAG: GNAT family N-acetyltransferase [Segniliparus sp.]|uniref:GNAT family N-acetyltransferase n=1 Tax=Segniliparus sp. TaxID=2804064 RepID=UPI003F2A1051